MDGPTDAIDFNLQYCPFSWASIGGAWLEDIRWMSLADASLEAKMKPDMKRQGPKERADQCENGGISADCTGMTLF